MFWQRFYELCGKSNTSPNNVAKALGLSSGSVTSWKNGKVPHHNTLIDIADYFDCSVDYLLGRTDIVSYKPVPAPGELTEHERLVLEAYRNNASMQSAVDKLLSVPTGGISIAEDLSETIRKIEAVSKADINKK
jgi:transcriptional regulator, XRE family